MYTNNNFYIEFDFLGEICFKIEDIGANDQNNAHGYHQAIELEAKQVILIWKYN